MIRTKSQLLVCWCLLGSLLQGKAEPIALANVSIQRKADNGNHDVLFVYLALLLLQDTARLKPQLSINWNHLDTFIRNSSFKGVTRLNARVPRVKDKFLRELVLAPLCLTHPPCSVGLLSLGSFRFFFFFFFFFL
ncbi:hypothetical protein BC940DRAFT_164996 [Gongronella butleri]|nr:hypothetical protein BC940DRAFT_164996 [Gongronella butleri]